MYISFISLVKFILQYLILSDTCKWNYLISLSDSLFFVYRVSFCTLIYFFPAKNILYSFISFNKFFFFGVFRVFLKWHHVIYHCWVLLLHSQFDAFLCLSLSLYLVWLLYLGLPILCQIKIVRVGTFILFLILGENFSAFHCWVYVHCGFVIYDFYYVDVHSLYT